MIWKKRKKMHKTTFLLLILVLLSISTGASELFQATTALNVRSGPGTEYDVLFTLGEGDKVEFISKHDNWYKIKFNDEVGYASGRYLKPLSNKIHPIILILGVVFAFVLLISIFFRGHALRTYGSIIALFVTFLYYLIGFWANVFSIVLFEAHPIGFLMAIITYVLAIFIGILSLISFFRNVGIGIIILSAIVVIFDLSSSGIPGAILGALALIGGVFITVGYAQVKSATLSN